MQSPITRSSGNVFADLGFDPEEAALLTVKTHLLSALAEYAGGFATQQEAAQALGESRPRISEIKNGKLSAFSTDKLLTLCSRAGIDVTIDAHLAAA